MVAHGTVKNVRAILVFDVDPTLPVGHKESNFSKNPPLMAE
jgi:hypothetical protein